MCGELQRIVYPVPAPLDPFPLPLLLSFHAPFFLVFFSFCGSPSACGRGVRHGDESEVASRN